MSTHQYLLVYWYDIDETQHMSNQGLVIQRRTLPFAVTPLDGQLKLLERFLRMANVPVGHIALDLHMEYMTRRTSQP
jgi:hypothetical protein